MSVSDYDMESRAHCSGCGVGLLPGERCPMKSCPHFGMRAGSQAWAVHRGATLDGSEALRILEESAADPVEARALARMRETERSRSRGTTVAEALAWLNAHDGYNLGPS